MKKILLLIAFLLITTQSFAQWGGGVDVGKTTRHRFDVIAADTWMSNPFSGAQNSVASTLAGYNKVRADFSVTDDTVSVVANLMVSNDTIWTSGDSITVTRDSHKDWDLDAGKRYYVYIESISSSDRVTVWLTPYNQK